MTKKPFLVMTVFFVFGEIGSVLFGGTGRESTTVTWAAGQAGFPVLLCCAGFFLYLLFAGERRELGSRRTHREGRERGSRRTHRNGRERGSRRTHRNGRIALALAAVSLAGFLAGFLCYERKNIEYGQDSAAYEGAGLSLTGTVQYIEVRDTYTACYVENACLYDGTEKVLSCGKLLLISETEAEEMVGMNVTAVVTVSEFRKASNPGNYDEESYYRSRGFCLRAYLKEWISASPAFLSTARIQYQIRKRLHDVWYKLCDEQTASIFCGMLLGESYEISSEDKTVFREGGIGHILAISALHVSFLGMAVNRLLGRLCSMRKASAVTVMIMLFYGALTGGSPSALRAVFMFSLQLLAKCRGRRYDFLSACSFSALTILMEEPSYLFYSGFQMSFAAIFGAAFFVPLWEDYLQTEGWIRKALVSSLVVQASILPVQLYWFYQMAPYGILINLLVLPTMGVVLGLAFTGGMLGMALPGAGKLILSAGGAILKGYLWLCEQSFQLPGSVWILGRPSASQIAIYCFLFSAASFLFWVQNEKQRRHRRQQENSLFFRNLLSLVPVSFLQLRFAQILHISDAGKNGNILLRRLHEYGEKRKRYRREEEKRRGFFLSFRTRILRRAAAVCLFAMLLGLLSVRGRADLYAAFLDVGQGDCIFIRSENGTTWLVDGGSSSVSNVGTYRILPYLKYMGVSSIDYVILTHTDSDHYSGLQEILAQADRGVGVGQFLVPDMTGETAWQELCGLAEEQDIPILSLRDGLSWTSEDVSMLCLWPEAGSLPEDVNESSGVLLCRCGNFSMLLTGDIGEETEKKLLKKLAGEEDFLPLVLLKAAHHGSRYSSCQEFLNVLSPLITVISAGEGNSYGHPHEETLLRLKKVHSTIYTTIDSGCVEIYLDDGMLHISEFKK